MFLLRPHILTLKNRAIGPKGKRNIMRGELLLVVATVFIFIGIYSSLYVLLDQTRHNPAFAAILPIKLMSLSLLGFFVLLLFSNTIAALGFFYVSRDLPLLLSAPVSKFTLYTSRLGVTLVNSSWIFALFAIPTVLAYSTALDLGFRFFFTAILVSIPFLLIPAAISSIVVTLFVNLVPVHRLQEMLLVISVVAIAGIFSLGQDVSYDFLGEEKKLQGMLTSVALLQEPNPLWLPSRWVTEILTAQMGLPVENLERYVLLLVMTALGWLALGFLIFDFGFRRGWMRSLRSTRSMRIPTSALHRGFGVLLIPFNPQLRALMVKELKMFMRDATQCVQLLLLLMLTFVYLYNFRALREITLSSVEAERWWQAILCIANLALGGCVIAAISTRFVFPAISLEGFAYWIVRSAPLSLKKLLQKKFITWLIPIGFIAFILFVSGALAIQAEPEAVILSGILALVLSVGIVGLGIGIGGYFAKFDWDSPTQVAASYGSLAFMLFALALIAMTLIPASLLFIFLTVPGLNSNIASQDYYLFMGLTLFLLIFINFSAARWGMHAGEQKLRDLER